MNKIILLLVLLSFLIAAHVICLELTCKKLGLYRCMILELYFYGKITDKELVELMEKYKL